MKKLLLTLILCFSAISASQAFQIGLSTGYTLGGDTDDTGSMIGAHAILFDEGFFSVELATLLYSEEPDSNQIADMDITSFAASLRFALPMADNLELFVLGGISWNSYDVNPENNYWLDVDDGQVGYHMAIGTEFNLGELVYIFAEYRHSAIDFKGDAGDFIAEIGEEVAGTGFDDTYDFGLLRVGFSIKL